MIAWAGSLSLIVALSVNPWTLKGRNQTAVGIKCYFGASQRNIILSIQDTRLALISISFLRIDAGSQIPIIVPRVYLRMTNYGSCRPRAIGRTPRGGAILNPARQKFPSPAAVRTVSGVRTW